MSIHFFQVGTKKKVHTVSDAVTFCHVFFERISLSCFHNEDRDEETTSILTYVGQVRFGGK